MRTRNVIIIFFLMGALFASWMQKRDLRDKVNQYETELIRATDEVMEMEEQNSYLRKQIESMQMYIDMNINPQFYTVDVESEEQLKTLGEF